MSPDNSALENLRIDRSAPEPRRSYGWFFVVAGLALAALAGIGWQATKAKPVQVRTLIVRESGGSSDAKTVLNASGYVVARREATVSSKVTGKVIEVLVEEGMTVSSNQVLARLDSSNIGKNFQLAEAQLEASRSSLNETRVRLDEAERELRRITELAKNNVSSPAELDRAEAEMKSHRARLDRQQADITVAGRQLALWQQELEDTTIRAPFAGIVTSKNAQPGEMISPISAGGGFTRTGICTIVDMSSLEIEVDVNESYINRVEAGQAVEATLDAYSEWKIPAKVIAIIPTADRQKATVKVRVGFDKLDPRFLPQMSAKVAFRAPDEGTPTARGMTVPKTAVLRRPDGKAEVWVAQNGRLERRPISTRPDNGSADVTVLTGLTAGEKIVIEPTTSFTEGTRIKEIQ